MGQTHTYVLLVMVGLVIGFVLDISAAPTQTPFTDAMYCHVCVDAVDDQTCNTTQYCQQGSGCLTSVWHDDSRRVIQKRCTTKEICNSMEKHNNKMCYNTAGGVFDGVCSFCCLTPGCNKDMPWRHATPESKRREESTPLPPITQANHPNIMVNKNDNQTPQDSCDHPKDNTGTATVDGNNKNVHIPGLKITINLEIPNQAHHCGCQDTTHPTQQTTKSPKVSTTFLPPTTSSATSGTTTPLTSTTASSTSSTTTATTTTTTMPSTTTTAPTKAITMETTTLKKPETVTPSMATTATTTAAPDTTPPVSTTTPKPTLTQTTLDPAGPKCYTCKGPTCQSHTLTTCPKAEPLCMNTLTQDITGKKTVSKRCASENVCKRDWFTHTSNLADCFLLSNEPTGSPGLKLDKCSFCCHGDGCNRDAMMNFDNLWFP